MVCDICKEADAVVQLTEIEGTGVRLLHLCERCAAERGVDIINVITKASNPVLSTDGRFMAFQSAKTTDPAGVGYGILIYWFKQ